ncbi:MAG: DeoR/GlpR transcriptional regulator [Ruminococcaceae bacterium]|nr:DeoR/GlpR transcriptional regulator [Oscillospiraceae bacterium]
MSIDREKQILEILLKEKRVTVKQLAKALFISEPSVRRDLQSLEKQNLIKRIHGGAVLEETALSKNRIPFLIREYEQSSAKAVIAKKAIELIRENDVIFLDASTSCYYLIPFLASKRNITVVTNGVKALTKLAEYSINTISTGGVLVNSCLALVGEEAYKTIENYNADIAFFSCRGISDDGYLTDIAPEENNIRKMMMRRSKKSYLLCASEKFGKGYFHNLCHKDELDGIIHE